MTATHSLANQMKYRDRDMVPAGAGQSACSP